MSINRNRNRQLSSRAPLVRPAGGGGGGGESTHNNHKLNKTSSTLRPIQRRAAAPTVSPAIELVRGVSLGDVQTSCPGRKVAATATNPSNKTLTSWAAISRGQNARKGKRKKNLPTGK